MNKTLLQVFLMVSLLLVFNVNVLAKDESVTLQLKVGEEVSFDEGNLVIHLVRIVEDERCPVNIGCIGQGM